MATSSSAPTTSVTGAPQNPSLDLDPQTPLTQRLPMPRALPTPQHTDPLSLHGLSESLPVVTTAAAPAKLTTSPLSGQKILDIHLCHIVKFQVTTKGEHFAHWRQIVISLLQMHKALDHVTEGAAPRNPSDDWLAVDLHIGLWFITTLSADLHRLVQGRDGRACSTWTRLHRFFYDNQASRYITLSKAFRTTPRGDLSINDYASKLQGIADDLAAIGRPVDDTDLTLQFIAGVGKKYKFQAEIFKNAVPLPSFADVCSRLQLAEQDADEQQHADAHVMAVHGGGRGQPHNTAPARPSGVSPNYRGKNPIPGYQHGVHNGAQHGAPPSGSGGRGRGNGASTGGRGSYDASGGRGGGGISGQQP
uniref:Uncharacterized protein n=1 Tax=Avena sativa TaxID=4498 RepID=A0ACD5VLD9_AVESA